MPSMIAILVADLQRHQENEARFAGLDAGQRSLKEQGLRMQEEIRAYICGQDQPVPTKRIAAFFEVSDECIRNHTAALQRSGKIAKLGKYPAHWWRVKH